MDINVKTPNLAINISTNKLDESVLRAQRLLNMQIAADCDPLIPFSQGALRNSIKYPDGISGGVIEYASPYAHYQYMGIVYGPNIPIKDADGNITGWVSPPKKYPTNRRLQYKQPGTTSHWFEEAKKQHENDWIALVKREVGKHA